MSTPLQQFRDNNPTGYSDYSDEQLLEYLHTNDPAYKDLDYETFKSLALNQPLSKRQPETKPELELPSGRIIPKEIAQVGAGITEQLFTGTADFIDFAVETVRGKQTPQQYKQLYKQAGASLGSIAFGSDLVPTTDKEGTSFYTNEAPSTGAGRAVDAIGSYIAAFMGGKKLIKEGAEKIFKKPITSKKGKAAEVIVAGELGAQVAIDYNAAALANLLGTEIGNNDNLLADVISMLQTSDQKSEAENRVALLGEGLLFAAGIEGGIRGGKWIINKLKEVRSQGPEAVESFSKTLIESSQSAKANNVDDQFINTTPNTDVIKELSFSSNGLINSLQRFWKTLSTSRGLYTVDMYRLKQKYENAEKAWAQRAENLAMELKFKVNKLANDFAPEEKRLNRLINEYLKQEPIKRKTGTTVIDGKKVTLGSVSPRALEELPKELQPIAKEIRDTVDELSGMVLQSKRVPEEIKAEIRENIGRYIRKTYEIFDNPNYRPSQEVYDNAVDYVARQLKKDPNIINRVNKGEKLNLHQEAKSRVDAFLETPLKSITYQHYDDMFRADLAKKIFAQRTKLAKPLKDLFGETTDAPTSVFRTIERMSRFYHRTQMYDGFLEAGKGKYFFRQDDILPEGIDSRFKQEKIKGKEFHTLDGMYTTPEIALLFKNVEELTSNSWDSNKFVRLFFGMKGMAQASATVGSWYTHLRNTIGGGIIMARNGMNPFSAETKESFKILQNQFQRVGDDDKALRELYEEFLSLGLVNQNVRVGDFKSLINDAANLGTGNVVSNQAWYREGLESGKTKALSVAKFAEKLYVAEDDLWRIAGFNKELQTLKQANDILPVAQRKTDDLLKQEAAEIIRNTMPTYSLVAPAAKGLRKLPIGNFFSFHAEQFRNMYHSLIRARGEIFSGNEVLVKRGYQRLAGATTIGLSGGVAMTEATKFAFGVSNEQHEAVKKLMLPEWSKNSDIAYGINPATGELYYIDLQFTDPTAPVTNLIKATLNEFLDPDVPDQAWEQRLLDATQEGMKSFLSPFVDETLLTTAAYDVLTSYARPELGAARNIKGFEEGASAINNLTASFLHILETQIPTTLKQLDPSGTFAPDRIGNQIYKQITENNPKTRYGEDLSLGTELLVNATGLRFYRVDDDAIETALKFKLNDLDKAHKTYSSQIRNSIEFGKTYQDVLDGYSKQNDRYYKEYVKGRLAVEGAASLGMKSFRIADLAKEGLDNFDKTERQKLLTSVNSFQPLDLTDQMMIDVLERNNPNGMSFRTFKRKYANIKIAYSQLPLLQLSEPTTTNRTDMSKGGLIEGPEVPFTKEDPAERVNPYTGEPYQQQMDILGFDSEIPRQRYSRGELVTSVIKGIKDFKSSTPKAEPKIRPTISQNELREGIMDLKMSQRRLENDPDFKFIEAYHGSPFNFQKFEAGDRLLTGEGANAFGKGLYFTENVNIAKTYKQKLTRKSEIQRIDEENKSLSTVIEKKRKDGDSANKELKKLSDNLIEQDKLVKGTLDVSDRGTLYKAEIKTSKYHLVDWDKTIGEQNRKIVTSFESSLEKLTDDQLESFIDAFSDYPSWTRDDLMYSREQLLSDAEYAMYQNKAGDVIPVLNRLLSKDGNKTFVEDMLKSDGVQGIRYFDGFSRKGKAKKQRNYVIFDPRIIEISKKYAIPIPLAGKMLMEMDKEKKDEL